MGLRTAFNKKALGGRSFYACIKGKILVAAPSAGSCAYDAVGDVSWDGTADNYYICTAAATTWVKLHA